LFFYVIIYATVGIKRIYL